MPNETPRKPITEDALNAPERQTIVMLALVSLATLVMWGAGRAACNLHPPRETRRPRPALTQELANNPKGAALEMQHRWATRDYAGALELATGSVAERVRRDLTACESKADECLKQREEVKDKVVTHAVLLERGPTSATARVESIGPGEQRRTHVLELEEAGSLWKVRAHRPDSGEGGGKPGAPPTEVLPAGTPG